MKKLEDDGDEDNGGYGDIGDDFIRGLMDIWTIYIFLKCFYFKNLCLVLYEFIFGWVWIVDYVSLLNYC